jgi:hypothetical protein
MSRYSRESFLPEELKSNILEYTLGEEEDISKGLYMKNETLIDEIRTLDPSFSLASHLGKLKTNRERLNKLKGTPAWVIYNILKGLDWDGYRIDESMENDDQWIIYTSEDPYENTDVLDRLEKYIRYTFTDVTRGIVSNEFDEPSGGFIRFTISGKNRSLVSDIQEINDIVGGPPLRYHSISYNY